MKTIVFVINQLRNSGPVRVLYNICLHLDRKEYTPVIIKLMDDDPTRSITHRFIEMGIDVIDYHTNFFQLECRTRHMAKRVETDASKYGENTIIHAHSYHPILLCSHIHKFKTIATIHSICGEDFVMSKGKILGHYMIIRFLHALKRINIPVAISEYMQNYYLAKGCNCRNMIYNGMDVDFSPSKLIKEEFLDEHKLNSHTKIILVSAWFSFRKNQTFVVKALKKLKREDFVVVFAGKGEMLDQCRKMTGDDKRFVFLGYRNDIYEWYKISDYYLSASMSEGMPLAVLEAVNYGLPVILSSIPPHEEISRMIYGNGKSLCFDYTKEDSLLSLFEEILDMNIERSRIKEIGQTGLSAKAMTENYCKLYKQM